MDKHLQIDQHMERKPSESKLLHQLIKMKGQAIPLFSYYVMRDHIIPLITGEHQNAILYWIGKNIACHLKPKDEEQLVNFFLELGWGNLQPEKKSKNAQTFILKSPFFAVRNIPENEASFAIECGFLAEALSSMHDVQSAATFLISQLNPELIVKFTVHYEDKESSSLSRPNE